MRTLDGLALQAWDIQSKSQRSHHNSIRSMRNSKQHIQSSSLFSFLFPNLFGSFVVVEQPEVERKFGKRWIAELCPTPQMGLRLDKTQSYDRCGIRFEFLYQLVKDRTRPSNLRHSFDMASADRRIED